MNSLSSYAMCQLCYDDIYDGEHWTDDDGKKYDSHRWCHLMDQAAFYRKLAAKNREVNNQPCIED